MEKNKFQRYCPNCNNYDESTGVCIYIHENVLQYPEKFIEYCDGKYLSLIKGRKIEPLIENDASDEDIGKDFDEDKALVVSVFSSSNNAIFQVAKSVLDNNKIKYFSSGDYLNVLNPAVYSSEIKVFEKDKETAAKLLSELVSNQYKPSNEFEKKMLSLRWYWNIVIIILLILLMVAIFLLLK